MTTTNHFRRPNGPKQSCSQGTVSNKVATSEKVNNKKVGSLYGAVKSETLK